MNSNVITENREMISQTDGLYGSNRITYMPQTPMLCGTVEPYAGTMLQTNKFKQITYDVSESFPSDQLSAALDAGMTELPQVTAKQSNFEYVQYAEGVEFIYSQMNNISAGNVTNIKAGTINELLKKWDHNTYQGKWAGNPGFTNNPNATSKNYPGGITFENLLKAVGEEVKSIKSDLTVTNAQIRVGLTSKLSNLIVGMTANGVTLRSTFEAEFPNIAIIELYDSLGENEDTFSVTATPFVRLHRGVMPQQYNEEAGKHGLSRETLFVLESAAVECELEGGIRKVKLTA